VGGIELSHLTQSYRMDSYSAKVGRGGSLPSPAPRDPASGVTWACEDTFQKKLT